ncbi:MAG TPA: hypothetical protein VHC71_04320 [Hyphomicrobium sp.]|nr:hypothetical protein [Hyphomicrobium sp.]
MQAFSQVVSLGWRCQTVWQARRYFGRAFCPTSIFDWQITPAEAVVEYFDRDFVGLLDRDDLFRPEDGWVTNRKFGTRHPHEFSNGLQDGYATARSRHDYLCDKLCAIIGGAEPTLFVAQAKDPETFHSEISFRISRRNPRLKYRLLVVPDVPIGSGADAWKGDDDHWDRHFSEFAVRHDAGLQSPNTVTKNLGTIRYQMRRFANHVVKAKF